MRDYEAIRHSLNTGDIVLFGGRGILSWLIKRGTKSDYSHIGVVVRAEDQDMLLVLESTTLSGKKGVQVNLLSERIQGYKGCIALRTLSRPISQSMSDSLRTFRAEIKGRPYEKSVWNLLGSIFNRVKGREDLSSLFCSELAAEAYQRMGLLTEDRPSDKYTPADFSERWMGRLEKGYALDDEERVK